MRKLWWILLLLPSFSALSEWHDAEAEYRVKVLADGKVGPSFADLRTLCLPVLLENGIRAINSSGKEISIHQYNPDQLLLPEFPEKTELYLYFGYPNKKNLQTWNKNVPPNKRLMQQDISVRYQELPREWRKFKEQRRFSAFARHRREFYGELEKIPLSFAKLHSALHANLKRNTELQAALDKTPFLPFLEEWEKVGDAGKKIIKHSSDELERLYFSRFFYRTGPEVPRIFFTQRPFDTDRNFVALFSGKLAVAQKNDYEFRINTNSTRIVRIDGKRLVRQFGQSQAGNTENIGTSSVFSIPLTRGIHPFEFLYYKGAIANWAAVSWRKHGEKEFKLLSENDFAPASPVEFLSCETKSGGRYPIVLRDDSHALHTGKREVCDLDVYSIRKSGDVKFSWNLDGGKFPEECNTFALKTDNSQKLILSSDKKFLPLEILRKQRSGIKIPVNPDVQLKFWAPWFLYDDEYGDVTMELSSRLPMDYFAILKNARIFSGSSEESGAEAVFIPRIPLECENRFAQNTTLKRSKRILAEQIKQRVQWDFSIEIPGLLCDSKSLVIVPASEITSCSVNESGLTDDSGRQLFVILHRSSLHELRAWELQRKVREQLKDYKKLLLIAENNPEFIHRLRENLAKKNILLEFIPWEKAELPSGSPALNTIPKIVRTIAETTADCALIVPLKASRRGISSERSELCIVSMIMELLRNNRRIIRTVLSSPVPDSFQTYQNTAGEESAFIEQLRKLRRERGTSFVELEARLRKTDSWLSGRFPLAEAIDIITEIFQ